MKKILILLFFSYITAYQITAINSTLITYKYEERTGKSVKYFTRIFDVDEGVFKLSYMDDSGVISTATYAPYETDWHFTDKKDGTDIFFSRSKNVIIGKGTFKSKTFNRKYQIDNDEWIQVIEFSLSDFVNSSGKQKSFWAIRTIDMNIFKMVMEKKGSEMITVKGKPHNSVKMVLSALGFSAFWHADYWFSIDDKTMMKYEAYRSMDKKDKTFIELISGIKK